MAQSKNILSVSQLNYSAKKALEQQLPSVWVQGELTNFAQPSSGHWYFTLKDAKAQVRCAMFRGKNIAVNTPIKAGDQVLLKANVSLYEGRGDYQLIVDSLQKAGLGDLHQQYEALKNALNAEGLFATQTKRALPVMPQNIGIISSPTGAAVHDILTVLKRRFPIANVIIYPAVVQGHEAPKSLINALDLANRHACCDILILGRGGGSLEDLWAFNNEQLVRRVYDSLIPVISAVGHEVDFTLTDWVADYRAPTPSAAAEAATPDHNALAATLIQKKQQLIALVKKPIEEHKRRIALAKLALQNPQQALRAHQQQLDYLEIHLRRHIKSLINQKRSFLHNHKRLLQRCNPQHQVGQALLRKQHLEKRLHRAINLKLAAKQQTFKNTLCVLHALSPLNTLQRGYTVVRHQDGKVISSATQITSSTTVNITFNDGVVAAKTL